MFPTTKHPEMLDKIYQHPFKYIGQFTKKVRKIPKGQN